MIRLVNTKPQKLLALTIIVNNSVQEVIKASATAWTVFSAQTSLPSSKFICKTFVGVPKRSLFLFVLATSVLEGREVCLPFPPSSSHAISYSIQQSVGINIGQNVGRRQTPSVGAPRPSLILLVCFADTNLERWRAVQSDFLQSLIVSRIFVVSVVVIVDTKSPFRPELLILDIVGSWVVNTVGSWVVGPCRIVWDLVGP